MSFESQDIPCESYRLRLMSDFEMKSKAEVLFSAEMNLSRLNCLDSLFYGSTTSSSGVCAICNARSDTCPGHSGVISLPFPIPRAICVKEIKNLIPLICPICSRVPLPDDIREQIYKVEPHLRLKIIKNEIEKISNKGENMFVCPRCESNTRLIKVIGQEPCMRFKIFDTFKNTEDFLNPIAIHRILNSFNDVELCGYNRNFDPKNWFTTCISIIPNKLRLKSLDTSVSVISSYYRMIIEEIIPELDKVYKSLTPEDEIVIQKVELYRRFETFYDQLNAYYMLLTDPTTDKVLETSLQLISKKDRKHVDTSNSIIGRIKDKDHSLFTQGIIDSRHDCSARTVLNGAPDTKVTHVNVPEYIASKMTIRYPVYEQNIKIMRAILAAMSDVSLFNDVKVPKVLYVYKNSSGNLLRIDPSNAQNQAGLLQPGDKLEITLINGDFVMHSRYPSIREESWTSLQINTDSNSVVTIPLVVCEMKQADFDGDEAQIFASSNKCYNIEALLLHSIYRQLIAYKNCDPALAITKADLQEGVPRIKPNKETIIHDWDVVYPPRNVLEDIENVLPKDLNYNSSDMVIENGKVKDKCNFGNKEFYKYVNTLYGPEICCNIMDAVIKTAYDLNRNDGTTLGFNIKVFDPKHLKEINQIKKDLFERLCEFEKENDINKDIKQMIEVEKVLPKVKEILLEDVKGTKIQSLAKSRLEEFSQMVFSKGQIKHEATQSRFAPELAEGTRTLCCFPKYSTDPRAYGYVFNGYTSDCGPVAQFYDAKSTRKNLYDRGMGTAIQGYGQKKYCLMYGTTFCDFNGGVVDPFRLVQLQYGPCGVDPRLQVIQPIPEYKDYKDKELKECHDLIEDWKERYSELSHEKGNNIIKNSWNSPFDYEMFLKTNAKKGLTSDKEIDSFIEELKEIFVPIGKRECNLEEFEDSIWNRLDLMSINLIHTIYYFRIKLREYVLTKELRERIIEIFTNSLVQGGEPVGMKAAIASTEPLTQSVLNSIHKHAGGVDENRVQRTQGADRFNEILGGAVNHNTVITIGLYDDSKESCIKFANEQETFFFNDIWVNCKIGICSSINPKIREYYNDIDFKEITHSPYYLNMIWNLSVIANYNIHPCDVIDRLMKNFDQILFIAGFVVNSKEFNAFVYFKPGITLSQVSILVEEWEAQKPKCVIHGKYLKNCYVCENRSKPGHYLIEGNEVRDDICALENLIYDERIDPYLCHTTNIEVANKMFGIFEGNAQSIAELEYAAVHLSDTSSLVQRIYKILADYSCVSAELLGANRYSLKNDEYKDPLSTINFESVKNATVNALMTHKVAKSSANHYVASQFWGDLPASGDSVSKVILYEK